MDDKQVSRKEAWKKVAGDVGKVALKGLKNYGDIAIILGWQLIEPHVGPYSRPIVDDFGLIDVNKFPGENILTHYIPSIGGAIFEGVSYYKHARKNGHNRFVSTVGGLEGFVYRLARNECTQNFANQGYMADASYQQFGATNTAGLEGLRLLKPTYRLLGLGERAISKLKTLKAKR